MIDAVLSSDNLCAGYGGRQVFADLSVSLLKGEVLCLLGHNGAGKSTLLKVLFGLHRSTGGSIKLRGQVVDPVPSKMARAGVAYMPEGRGIFPALTVRENFNLGLWSAGVVGSERTKRVDSVVELLPRIRDFFNRRAGTLSGGQQQMVSIGRALLSNPEILLLDEPSIGLAPKLFQDLLAPVREAQKRRGMSIILVEQNVSEAFSVSDRVIVMKSGKIVFRGIPSELADRSKLIELF